jgi:cellobiose-specific phosphotransferase system component IIA
VQGGNSLMNAFEELEKHYPEIIGQMDRRFNSHEFILELAHRYQGLYIKALAQYAESKVPFQVVHGQLARMLAKFPHLVYYIGNESSTDIFGHSSEAAVWGKR